MEVTKGGGLHGARREDGQSGAEEGPPEERGQRSSAQRTVWRSPTLPWSCAA